MQEKIPNEIQTIGATELVRIKKSIVSKLPASHKEKSFRLVAIQKKKQEWEAHIIFRDNQRMEVNSTDEDIY